jgi:hypothetical protein
MKSKNLWADITILNLCIVASLGFILRSKILFALPGINYLNLLDAHSHFAFGGWVTLALLFLMVNELLSGSLARKPVYDRLLVGFLLSSFGILFTMYFNSKSVLAGFFSTLFILISYAFGWVFIKDIRKTGINKTVQLLSVTAIVSMILSSIGIITGAYLHSIKSLPAIFFLDTLYVYLHFQYNGFFTFAVFALLFHKLYPKISKKNQQNFYQFSVLLTVSVIPSLFLSFLWQDPNNLYRTFAVTGSILIFVSVGWFIISALPLLQLSKMAVPVVRYILFLSISAFILKMFLQSFTIFPSVGNAVFGDRPVIIGYLHLVFLGFVSPFILAYYMQKNLLNSKIKLTGYAIIIFMLGVVCNEITLMLQGLGAMFLISSYLFSWLLWAISIWMMAGAILIFAARIKSKNTSTIPDNNLRNTRLMI